MSVRLPVRAPFAGDELVRFVGAHAVPGLEHLDDDGSLRRSLALPYGHGIALLRPGDTHVHAELRLADWRDLAPAVERLRRWLDLDADPIAVDEVLAADPALADAVRALPGIRSPGSTDPFEAAVRTIIGQQVSVAGGSTVTGRIVAALGEPLSVADPVLTHVFPTPERLAAIDPADLPLPRRRGATIRRLATAVADGTLHLDATADRAEVRARLAAITGIGPWSIAHIEMRGFGDPDVFLEGDLVARRALDALALTADAAERWRPWRSYATRHLWNTVWRP